MSVEIVIPDVAESIEEVVIGEWLKQDGDFVKRDEEVCEVETDKASQSLVSPADGILKIKIEAGETIPVGTVIATVEPGGEASIPSTSQEESTPASTNTEFYFFRT